MLLLSSILLAQAVAAAPPPKTVSPLVVTPPQAPAATLAMPSSDEDVIGQAISIWPQDRYHSGVGGKVVLSCRIDIYGLAEECRIASETPPGKGLGAAALQLRPTIKVEPARGPAGPVAAVMNIAVDFQPPGATHDNSPSSNWKKFVEVSNRRQHVTPITMLDRPIWTRAPSFDDLAKAYPAGAGGAAGYAVAHCRATGGGGLGDCEIVKETPQGEGFGRAALTLARDFRLTPDEARAAQRAPVWIDVPIRMPAPGTPTARAILSPVWLAGLDPKATLKVFPPEAAAQGVVSGRGVAHCRVTSGGAMADCRPAGAEPEGLGFSEAAVRLASTLKMNLWSADAAPVEGGVVDVGVRFLLKGSTSAQ